ncbi:MAG TPA: hypothetical protein VIN75_19245 [Burkholderiaceae bacterium]
MPIASRPTLRRFVAAASVILPSRAASAHGGYDAMHDQHVTSPAAP